MLFTDDQRFDAAGSLGDTQVRTPHIDSLVQRGTTFRQNYIMGSTQGAVCICSRASLMTGCGLFHAGDPRNPTLPLWPETFRQAGYTTFGTGKWHNGPEAYARSFTCGEAIFFGGMCNHRQVPIHDFDPTGRYAVEDRHVSKVFSSELFADAAERFLRGYEEDNPFLAYVSFTAPHDPRMAPREYEDLYPRDRIELPPNILERHPFDNGEMTVRDETLAPWPRSEEIVREHVAAYYAMISHVDAQIGGILQTLGETGHADDTIVIFAGDNGLAVGQHGLMGKQNLYEHSLKVPLVFAGPDIPKGKDIQEFSYLHDVFPTTCELAGVEMPQTVRAAGLADSLETGHTGRESIFGAYRGCQRGIRKGRWKLIRYLREERRPWTPDGPGEPFLAGSDHLQLFDLHQDPWETNNLADRADTTETREQLLAELATWQQREADPLLT